MLLLLSRALLNAFDTVFGLFASTVGSCLIINTTASDQYLAIMVQERCIPKHIKTRIGSELIETLEDSGTVTSVLIP